MISYIPSTMIMIDLVIENPNSHVLEPNKLNIFSHSVDLRES